MEKQVKTMETKINFQLKNIELIETCINSPQKQLDGNSVFQFDINLEHRVSVDGNNVFVICSISVLNDTKGQVFGNIKASCIFEVKELSQFLDKKTKKHKLPGSFILTLNSISISTLRGLMFSFFRGTYLHNAVLPIIDPKDFQKNL
ncbi:MAG: hypothetical protein K0B09_07060 [Bacteroidales bacterium]|nr:hypothetical protein [Bacteroidales bacterium]